MAEVIIEPDAASASALAAEHIAEAIRRDPQLVLGVATGSTPSNLYSALAQLVRARSIDVSGVRVFSLDEYVGLGPEHPASYAQTVAREVTAPIGFDPALVRTPDGAAADPFAAAVEYEQAIQQAGGVSIQVLGIGHNGHLAFNEPGSSLGSRTRVKTLTEQTRDANARFFDDPDAVPKHCITQGVGTILEARHLMLLAFGEGKAAAVAQAVEGPVSARCPASAVQLHPHVTVLLDEDAAAQLEFSDEYRRAWRGKPDAQSL